MKKTSISLSAVAVPCAAGDVQELPHMKNDRPLLSPDKLDAQVQECLKELRKCRASVCIAVVVAVLKV